MNDGLTDSQRLAISGALADNPKVTRAVLFGSRALGSYRPASDVDLALFGEALTISDLIDLQAVIAGFNFPVEVDLLIYHQIDNENLRRHIDTKGVSFFAR